MSLSFDFAGLLENAATFVNGIFPAYALPLGIILAMGILTFVVGAFSGIFRRK